MELKLTSLVMLLARWDTCYDILKKANFVNILQFHFVMKEVVVPFLWWKGGPYYYNKKVLKFYKIYFNEVIVNCKRNFNLII